MKFTERLQRVPGQVFDWKPGMEIDGKPMNSLVNVRALQTNLVFILCERHDTKETWGYDIQLCSCNGNTKLCNLYLRSPLPREFGDCLNKIFGNAGWMKDWLTANMVDAVPVNPDTEHVIFDAGLQREYNRDTPMVNGYDAARDEAIDQVYEDGGVQEDQDGGNELTAFLRMRIQS